MTRVLFVAESFFPVFGGGERHIEDLSAALVQRGLGATVLTRRGKRDWPSEEMRRGVRVVRVAPAGPGRIGKYGMVPFAVAWLLRQRHTYDVAIVCGTRILALPVLLASLATRRPVVLQAEMTGELTGEIYVWGTAFHRPSVLRALRPFLAARNVMFRRSRAFVAISRLIEREALDEGFARENVAYIPHAVDVHRFRPATGAERAELRARLGLPPDRTLVTFTGRLLKGKGLDVLVSAFAGVVREHQDAHLVVVGSGESQMLSVEQETHAQVGALDLRERVTFTGRVDNVEDYLRASDIFAFPSLYEGLPHSPLEAAAAGLPAAASRAGGIPDVVLEGENGWLSEPGDVDGLRSSLARLLGDPGERARLAARARDIAVERFSLEAVTERYRKLFERVATSDSVSRGGAERATARS